MIIRRAQGKDKEEILALIYGLNKNDYLCETWPLWMSEPDNLQLVAIVKDQIAGCVHGRMTAGSDAWAQGMRVRADFRRRGIATSLLSALENELYMLGAETVFAVIGRFNQPSLSTVAKLEWEIALPVVRRSLNNETLHLIAKDRSTKTPRMRSIAGRQSILLSSPPRKNRGPGGNHSYPSFLSADILGLSRITRVSGALASRKATAFFGRIYSSMTDEFLSEALAKNLLRINEYPPAVAFLDQQTDENKELWVIALSGYLSGLTPLLHSLAAEAAKGDLPLVVDSPADPDMQILLDCLGFAPSKKEGQYVVVKKILSRIGQQETG